VDIEDGGNANSGTFGTGRGKWLVNASNAAQLGSAGAGAAGSAVVNDSMRAMQPDLVGNLRVDQAWGSAQIMAAIHNASGGYYSNLPGLVAPAAGVPPGLNPGSFVFGHPGEAWGWAAGAGIRFVNFLLPKDTVEAQFNYAKGAMGYVLPMNASTSYANDFVYGSGNSVGIGYAMDGVFVNGSQVHLTEAWSLSAAYQHYWNTQWRTSVIGGYSKIHYDGMAQGMLCGTVAGSGAFALYGTLVAGASFTNCNPDFSLASVSTRTAWNPHPSLEIGLDLIWNHVQTANAGSIVNLLPSGGRPGGLYTVANQDNYFLMMRFQKNILP
jgi:hypothetical protein